MGNPGEPRWQGDTLICFARIETDQRVMAERRWKAPLKAPKPQAPCDHGLFSDEALQLDLVEMFQDPTNEE